MTTMKSILSRLIQAVSGTDKELFSEQELNKLMREGYCADMGVAYYCSKDCLHSDFTDEEWAEECESNDQSYYTEW